MSTQTAVSDVPRVGFRRLAELLQQLREHDERQTRIISDMTDILLLRGKVLVAMERQKNISQDVKDGIAQLKELVCECDNVRIDRDEWAVALSNWLVDMEAIAAPAVEETRKRGASTPLTSPEGAAGHTTTEQASREWETIRTRRKKKRKKVAPDVSPPADPPYKERLPQTQTPGTASQKEKRRETRVRDPAVLIKPAAAGAFADVLGEVQEKVNLGDSGTVVRRVRKTQDGGILLEIAESRNKGALEEAIREAVGDRGHVKGLDPRLRLEIRDLDACATEADVSRAIREEEPEGTTDVRVVLFPVNRWGQRTALVEIGERAGRKLLQKGKLKVGKWGLTARVVPRTEAERCFRCLGYGHRQRDCKGPDRSNACRKCGVIGHKVAACTAVEPTCYLCPIKENGAHQRHMAGSGACSVFRRALEECRRTKVRKK